MRSRRPSLRFASIAAAMAVALAGCAERDTSLRLISSDEDGPEEFSIVPTKPLTIPENLAALPAPTPGGANRTDQRPAEDAVAALGGDPARLRQQGGVPASDGALIAATGRFGRADNVRATLAAEDEEFRRRKSLFTFQIFPRDEYNAAYSQQSLDQRRELQRFRNAGARTPAAPPPGVDN